jgi:hypothetical protein
VHFCDARAAYNFDYIVGNYAGGGNNADAPVGLLHQFLQLVASFQGGGHSARGEQFVASAANNLFQGLVGIAALVEGTVEGDAQALGGLDSTAGLVGVDVAVGGEESYHHSVGSQLGGQLDVAQYYIHLLFGVAEIPSAWAYQYTGMQVQAVGTVFDGCRRWCGAAFAQGSESSSLPAYVRELRLDYAIRLMNNQPDISIDTVSQGSGFTSADTFTRNFRAKYGMTPTAYKQTKDGM